MNSRTFIRFFGRVQGVCFRWTTLQIAAKFPLTGRIENMPDGTVEMVIEGDEKIIATFLATALGNYKFPIDCSGYEILRTVDEKARYTTLEVGPPL